MPLRLPRKSKTALGALRVAHKMSQYEVVERLQAYGLRITTVYGLSLLEKRGTRDLDKIAALAEIYGMSHDELAGIAKPSGRKPARAV